MHGAGDIKRRAAELSRVRSGWGRRTCALLLVLVCAVAGCSHNKEEPGLFGRSPDPTTVAPLPTGQDSDTPTPHLNPDLPVVGDAVWDSGEGLDIQVRIAVHAVRRIVGATVLDWSITPLRGRGLSPGDPVPGSLNLGLTRVGEDNSNVFLLDALAHQVYRPLTRPGFAGWPTCLCSPVRLAERNLRIGETHLMQIAFPALPPDLATIDVDVATVPIFWHVPVTPVGMVPEATSPTDLAQLPDVSSIGASSAPFRYGDHQLFVVSVDQIIGASTVTSLQWTIQSVTAGPGLDAASTPPFAEAAAARTSTNRVSASGPLLRPANDRAGPIRVLHLSVNGRGRVPRECLCTDLRLWTASLEHPEKQVSVVTNFPPLARGTQQVDVEFPGLTTLRGVAVTDASDSTGRSAGPVRRKSLSWTFDPADAPAGWSVDQWPTPLPARGQLSGYRADVESLLG